MFGIVDRCRTGLIYRLFHYVQSENDIGLESSKLLVMRRFVLIALIIAIVGMVVYWAIFQPLTSKNLWLWIVGFAGLIWSAFRGLFDFLAPNSRSLNEIEADNKVLKNRLEEINTELQEARQLLANERADNHRLMENLNASIEGQKALYDKSRLE